MNSWRAACLRGPALAAALLVLAPAASATPRRLFLDGDSLAVGTSPYLPEALPGWRIRTSAAVGRRSDEGLDVLREARRLAPYVGVSLGTNDDPRIPQAFEDTIDEAMRIAGPERCVIWADIVRPAVAGVSYRAMNAVLRREARGRENLEVVGWARMVRRHPEWLAADGVHASAAGYRARARAYGRATRRCP
jgi:hypothetical protein